ncbi:hypothetical protein AHAS_Ahas11G0189700 [Arachis hypogaea]
MATRGRGHSRTRRDGEDDLPADNHAEFMAAMTHLANTMQVNAAATAQAMERMGNGNVNGNGSGNGNGNREGAGRGLGSSVPIKLATFLKVNPPSSRGLIDPTKADD